MAESIRDIITRKSEELRDTDSLGPHKVANELVELTSLLSSLNREIVDSEAWYKIRKMELLKEHGSAAKATIFAEASEEYKQYRDRIMQGKAVEELIRSLKYYLKTSEFEYKEGRY